MTQPILNWLKSFESYIKSRQFDEAKALFCEDTHAFGTWTFSMENLDELYNKQWNQIWDKIQDFSFDWQQVDLYTDPSGSSAHIAARWTTQAIDKDSNKTFKRPGRATLFLVNRNGEWKGRHSHFSLDPAFNRKANNLKEI